jgi:hypothetical protein
MRSVDLSVLSRYNFKKAMALAESNNLASPVAPTEDVTNNVRKKEKVNDVNKSSGTSDGYTGELVKNDGELTPKELKKKLSDDLDRKAIKQKAEIEDLKIDADADTEKAQIEAQGAKAQIEAHSIPEQAKLYEERKVLEAATENLELKQKLDREVVDHRKSNLDNDSLEISNEERRHLLETGKLRETEFQKRQKMNRIFRGIAMAVIAILSLIIIALLLWRMYRWSVEEPLIKEVEKVVKVVEEVSVEVIKEVEVEKTVIPEECTQIRRNGKVFISCDGVTVEGASTIGDSGKTVPDLLGPVE